MKSIDVRKVEIILRTISMSRGQTNADYGCQCRKRKYTWLRFIAAHLLKRYVQDIGLQDIAEVLGMKDHTISRHAIIKAESMIELEDLDFIDQYETAEENTQKILLKNGYDLTESPIKYTIENLRVFQRA